MIWMTGDLHGGDSAYHVSSERFSPQSGGIFAFVVETWAVSGGTITIQT
jgi:hypothetical protein